MTITSEFDTAVARMTRDEAKILAHYAAGESTQQIVDSVRLPRGEVTLAIDTLAKNNRNLAQNLATAWQQANPATRANGNPVPQPRPPAAPLVTRRGTIGDQLDRAALSDAPKLVKLAERIQDLVAQLEEQLAEFEQSKALRDEQAKLEARLAEIRQKLNPKRPAAAGTPTAGRSGADPKAIRAWAAANGVDCPAKGRVPGSVVAAYEARGDA